MILLYSRISININPAVSILSPTLPTLRPSHHLPLHSAEQDVVRQMLLRMLLFFANTHPTLIVLHLKVCGVKYPLSSSIFCLRVGTLPLYDFFGT